MTLSVDRIAADVAAARGRDSRGGWPGGLIRRRRGRGGRRHGRAGGGPGHGADGAGAARRGAPGRDAAPQPSRRPAGAVRTRPGRGGPAARRRGRVRDHRQRRPSELYVVVEVPRPARWSSARPLCEWWRRWGSAVRWRGCWGSTKTGRASATWRPTSPTGTTTAACCCSRRGPGSGSRSPTWCRRCAWSRANGERTVISTNTINLQEQLVGKDLPLLRRGTGGGWLGAEVRAAQGVAELSLSVPAAAWPRGAQQSAAGTGASRTSWSRSRNGPSRTADGTLSDLPVQPSQRGLGRGLRRGGSLHPGQVPPSSTGASCSGPGGERPRPTWWW